MTQIFAPFQLACLAALKVLRSGYAYVHGQNEFFSRLLESCTGTTWDLPWLLMFGWSQKRWFRIGVQYIMDAHDMPKRYGSAWSFGISDIA